MCIGFASRLRSTDLSWAAMGGGHDRRAEWGYSSGADHDVPSKLQLVSWAHHMEFGGSDAALQVWKQKLEERDQLLRVRRSMMASPLIALPLSPSKFNFVAKPHASTCSDKELLPLALPKLLQVRLFHNFARLCLSPYSMHATRHAPAETFVNVTGFSSFSLTAVQFSCRVSAVDCR